MICDFAEFMQPNLAPLLHLQLPRPHPNSQMWSDSVELHLAKARVVSKILL